MIEDLRARGIGFRSISDSVVDTTSPSGELVCNLFSAVAQFERRLNQERTKAGLEEEKVEENQYPPMTRKYGWPSQCIKIKA